MCVYQEEESNAMVTLAHTITLRMQHAGYANVYVCAFVCVCVCVCLFANVCECLCVCVFQDGESQDINQ